MSELHPSELELLAHVEGELEEAERERVTAHVVGCSTCAGTVAELEAARAALRSSPLLEPPPELRRRLSDDLDLHTPPRRVYVSSMRLVTLLAPVAIVFALVAAVAALQRAGGGDEMGGGGGGEAARTTAAQGSDDAGGGAGEPTTEGAAEGAEGAATPLLSVAGPPGEVVARLRARGLDARLEDGRVVVRGGPPSAVRRALAGRPSGDVDVLLEER